MRGLRHFGHAAIARQCVKWMRLSKPKLRDRVDRWVAKHDPAAVRVPPTIDEARYIEVEETSPGMAGIWANVRASDAALFDCRLEALAATVCDLDPRTKQQRRSDALGPLARREDVIACRCGSPDCAAGAERKVVNEDRCRLSGVRHGDAGNRRGRCNPEK